MNIPLAGPGRLPNGLCKRKRSSGETEYLLSVPLWSRVRSGYIINLDEWFKGRMRLRLLLKWIVFSQSGYGVQVRWGWVKS